MKIGIVGYGYVGKALHEFFGDKVASIYDPSYKKIPKFPKIKTTKSSFYNLDLAVVSVPTNEKKDGSCDVSLVDQTIKWLPTKLILIKSTVIPGTTEKLSKKYKKNLVFSPEYIGEGNYYTPPWKYPDPKQMIKHEFQIFGGPRKVTNEVVDIFVSIMGPHVSYMQTDAKTAETVKYMVNSWGATKVTFANEWFDICKTLGVDYREVRELWALDSRVEKMHTAVFKDKRGYGGKCFPKDMSAIIAQVNKKGYKPKFLESVKTVNSDMIEKNKK